MKLFRIWWFMRAFHKNLMKFHKNFMEKSWKKLSMDEDFFMTTQNHFFQSESKKSMIHFCFFHFRFLMLNFSVRNNHLICHLLRYFVPFFNKKNGPTIDYYAFGSFFWFFNEKTTWSLCCFFWAKKSS